VPVWTGAENLVPTGIRSPDRPARRHSLYRLSYSAQFSNSKLWLLCLVWVYFSPSLRSPVSYNHICFICTIFLPVWSLVKDVKLFGNYNAEVKMSLYTPRRYMRKCRYGSLLLNPGTRRGSLFLFIPGRFLRSIASDLHRNEAGWSSKSVWKLRRRDNTHAGNQTEIPQISIS
jgi:hypothetical protein